MKVCILTIRDGRDDIHERSIASLKEMTPQPEYHIVVDDADHELGFYGAIAEGWRRVRETDAEWVFHHEADFLFHAPIPLDRMIHVLKTHPRLAQLSLKRQPVNEQEKAAGGIIECRPAEDFVQVYEDGDVWIQHRCFFTTNPCLYPAALCAQPWPQETDSEGKFTHRLLEDPEVHFGIWGAKKDPPLVEHIGERCGVGY